MADKKPAPANASCGCKECNVGDIVEIKSEVMGMRPGYKGEITEVKAIDSIFRIKMIDGPKEGEDFIIYAQDLK